MKKKIIATALAASLALPGVSSFAAEEGKKPVSENAEKTFLVTFDADSKHAAKLENQVYKKYVSEVGGKVKHEGQELPFLEVELTEKEAEKLRTKKGIKSVSSTDTEMKFVMNSTNPKVTPEFSSYDYTDIYNSLPAENKNLKGDGVKILVADGGGLKDYMGDGSLHPDLKIEKQDDGMGSNMTDHGTRVTGIINGQHNGYGIKGIAPNARVFYHNVADGQGNVDAALLAKAWDFAAVNGIDIINMSITGAYNAAEYDLMTSMDQKNIIMIAAAGNDNANIDNYNIRGDGGFYFPANHPAVHAVSATHNSTRTGETVSKASYSNFGTKISLMGKAGQTSTSQPHWYWGDGHYYVDGQNLFGTSFAAPHVVAVVALYKQKYPHLSADALMTKVKSEALNTALASNVEGSGVVNAPQDRTTQPTLDQLNHGFTLYTAYNATNMRFGQTFKVYSRLMDDPTTAPASPKRAYEVPFEKATIRHTISKVPNSNGDTFTTAITTSTDGRHDWTIPVNTTYFPTKGYYDIFTRASYTDPVTGQYLYTYKVHRIYVTD